MQSIIGIVRSLWRWKLLLTAFLLAACGPLTAGQAAQFATQVAATVQAVQNQGSPANGSQMAVATSASRPSDGGNAGQASGSQANDLPSATPTTANQQPSSGQAAASNNAGASSAGNAAAGNSGSSAAATPSGAGNSPPPVVGNPVQNPQPVTPSIDYYGGTSEASPGQRVYIEWEVRDADCGVFFEGGQVSHVDSISYVVPNNVTGLFTYRLEAHGLPCDQPTVVSAEWIVDVYVTLNQGGSSSSQPQSLSAPLSRTGTYDSTDAVSWDGAIQLGADSNNHILWGYFAFDLSSLPLGVDIHQAILSFNDCSFVGDLTSNYESNPVIIYGYGRSIIGHTDCHSPAQQIDVTSDVASAVAIGNSWGATLSFRAGSVQAWNNQDDLNIFKGPSLLITYTP